MVTKGRTLRIIRQMSEPPPSASHDKGHCARWKASQGTGAPTPFKVLDDLLLV